MFGKKQKSKNKFHLPSEEPKPEGSNTPPDTLYSDALTPEVYSEDGAEDEAEVQSGSVASVQKYRFITSEAKLAEKKPTRNWEIYYRDREYAGGVGDPLLKVVEASSRQEAESKARMSEGRDATSEVIAVNTSNPIIRYKKESAFSFPSASPPSGNDGSKIFPDKA